MELLLRGPLQCAGLEPQAKRGGRRGGGGGGVYWKRGMTPVHPTASATARETPVQPPSHSSEALRGGSTSAPPPHSGGGLLRPTPPVTGHRPSVTKDGERGVRTLRRPPRNMSPALLAHPIQGAPEAGGAV